MIFQNGDIVTVRYESYHHELYGRKFTILDYLDESPPFYRCKDINSGTFLYLYEHAIELVMPSNGDASETENALINWLESAK